MNKNYNMDSIIHNIDKVKEMKASKKKRPSTSIRPLKFKEDSADSPLKAEIIRRINEKNLTYADMYEYCTKVRGNDIAEGQNLGYNIIYGLKHRHTMIDTTFTMLCDFLNLDITLTERPKDPDDDDDILEAEIDHTPTDEADTSSDDSDTNEDNKGTN